jgi:hypothetical protein
MKKLVVLSVLLGLLALPVFATHVSIDMGGDLTFGFLGDFGDNELEATDLTWDVMVGIDDFNSFTWSLKGLNKVFDTGDPDIGLISLVLLDQALVTTDIGKWLDLPVGIKVMWGYDDPDANEFGNVTGYENQVYDFSPLEYWGVGALVSYKFLELEVAFNPGVAAAGDLGYLLAGVAAKEPIAGLNAEVYMFQAASAIDAFDLMQIGIGASYQMAFGDLSLKPGVSFLFDMNDANPSWQYGLGVKGVYKMIEATVDILGLEDSFVDKVRPTVIITPIEKASVYAGMILSFTEGDDAFNSADFGVQLNVGIVDIFIGYMIAPNGVGSEFKAPDVFPHVVVPPAEPCEGGMYIKFDVDY